MTGLFRDLRDAARSLLRSPGLTAVAVLTLALGIGATTSVFTVAWRVLARPLPYAEAGELAAVFTTEPGAASQRNPTSPANFLDWAARSETLGEWTAAHPWSPALTGAGPADQIPALKATPSLFTLLGASPALGSVFRGDAELGDGRVVVLSHRLWSRRFGSDPAGQDPGFRAEAVLTADLALGASVHGEAERQPLYFGRVLEAVAAVPGVESAALVNHLPIAGDVWRGDLDLEGRPELDPPPKAILRVVSPGYFEALGVPVLEGRGFAGTERPDGPRQVVVNRALAELLPARASAVGARLRFTGGSPEGPWMEVVGVAGDARQDRLRDPVEPEVYFPYAQNPFAWFRQATLVVRTAGGALDLLPAVQAAVRGVDEEVPMVRARALEEVLAHDLAGPRFLAALLGGFAAVAVLLAAVGLYGLVSFAVRRRRWEIGLRMSLGADRLDVLRLVVVEGTALAGLGLALGLAGALAAGRLLEGLLYGVRPTDPASFALGGAVLLAAALAASYLPARRALAVDPAESLRAE